MDEVAEFLPGIPESQDLVRTIDELITNFLEQPVGYWQPPPEMDNSTREFYTGRIATHLNKANLLLTGLPPEWKSNSLIEDLFGSWPHRIFGNIPGFGKTRTLLEGLCHHWGFYFVGPGDCESDGIGSIDLKIAFRLRWSRTWTYLPEIPRGASSPQVLKLCQERVEAAEKNIEIVQTVLCRAFYARCYIYRRFIEIATDKGYPLNDALKHRWLLFQLDPPKISSVDLFTSVTDVDLFTSVTEYLDLANTMSDQLLKGITRLSPQGTLQKFGPNGCPDGFFFVLDEAQDAGWMHQSMFCDAAGKYRPLLHPILRFFEKSPFGSTQFILSGTFFSQELFQSPGIAKPPSELWHLFHGSGSFDDSEIQERYIRRYMPSSFLETPSGKLLLERLYRWLRGRHRLTVGFLEGLINGPWKGDHPASPHHTFDTYVMNFTGFQPEGEVDERILADEPKGHGIKTRGFPLHEVFFLSKHLAQAVYSYMTRGEWSTTSDTWKALLACGIVRYNERDQNGQINEPLALKGLLSWLHDKCGSLQQDIQNHFDHDRGVAWERALVVCLTSLLRVPRRLDEIAQFAYPIPLRHRAPLNKRTAQLIVGYDGSDYSTEIGSPSMWSSDVVLKATSVDNVRDWLHHGKQPWCRPPEAMGPDLLCWLKLNNGNRVLLATRAKPRVDEGDTLATATSYWKSISDEMTNLVHLATPHPEAKQPRYGFLWLIASYPGDVDFPSKAQSIQNTLKDKHPLAILRNEHIIEAFPMFSTGPTTPQLSLSSLPHSNPKRTTGGKASTSGSKSSQQNVGTSVSEATVAQGRISSNVTAVKRRTSGDGEGPQPEKTCLGTQESANHDGSVRRSTRQRKPATKP